MTPYDPQESDKLKDGARMRIENRVAGRKEKSPLQQTQESVKKLVDRGEITKAQGICIILQKAMDLLEELKIPENQDWEKQEYPELFQEVN